VEADFSQEDMESIQGGLDPSGATGGTVPSGFSSDLGSGDSAEDFNSFVTGLTPQQAYTTGRGAKSKALGDNVNNPFPESFFSKLFGAENVDYSNILNTPGGYTPAGINQLRFNQSQNPQNFGMGDFYLGQDTVLGEVKPVPSMADTLLNFLPGGGILNAFIPQKGLPKFDPRYQEVIKEREKSANDPTIFDSVQSFVRSITGLGPKDSGASLATSPTGDGQMRVPDTRTFDAFGNVTGSDLDTQDRFKTIEQLSEDRKRQNAINAISDMFQAKPKVQKVADNTFNLLQGIGTKFNPQINEILRQNVSPNLEFESDYRQDPFNPDEMMPYIGLKYGFTV
tara:strand:+ start:52 stop:1068 length:1017 start_codon:yes stop_codon:yes gene_type:complete